MLFRILVLVFTMSFIFSAPKGITKKSKGSSAKITNKKVKPLKNMVPSKTKKQLKNFVPAPSKKELTYKVVAKELQNSKNLTRRLSKLEQQSVVDFLAGKRRGGTYLKHLSNAMKKHKCYNGNNKNEKLNKFRGWPTISDKVEWFSLDCSVKGTPPINPKESNKNNKSK